MIDLTQIPLNTWGHLETVALEYDVMLLYRTSANCAYVQRSKINGSEVMGFIPLNVTGWLRVPKRKVRVHGVLNVYEDGSASFWLDNGSAAAWSANCFARKEITFEVAEGEGLHGVAGC